MSEPRITGAVGAHPAPNTKADVKTVQTLLSRVAPRLSTRVELTGVMDGTTMRAIREFQARFMRHPDSRVDPDGRTLWHLGEGFVTKYVRCDAAHRRILDHDLMKAQTWLDTVNARLAVLNADAKTKVNNVFHIDADDSAQLLRLTLLRFAFVKLRSSLNEDFPLQYEQKVSLYGAWVDLNDTTGTMHFPSNHFSAPPVDRIARVIHERSHTVFKIGHDGMKSKDGSVDFGQASDDDNGFTYDQSVRNAYCYGWLAAALQPDYVSGSQGEVITVTPRNK
jgi:hypothetical protein